MAKILEMKAAAAKRLAPPACGKCASGDDGSFAAYVPGKYAYPPAASIRRHGGAMLALKSEARYPAKPPLCLWCHLHR